MTAAALTYFKMKTVDDELPPQVIGDLTQLSMQKRKICFNRIVQNVLALVVKLPDNPGTTLVSSDEQDGVFNYAREVLTYTLLHAEFLEAIREGDGPRVVRCWKFFLLIFKASNRTKYALEVATLLINLQVMPERIQQQMLWSRFVNPSGKVAHNKPCDLHMEHLNRTAKDALGQHSHLNPRTVTRVGKCIGLFRHVQQQFDAITGIHHTSGTHVCASAETDLRKIVQQLMECQVFQRHSNRYHKSFTRFNITRNINVEKFYEWLHTHIQKVQLRYRHLYHHVYMILEHILPSTTVSKCVRNQACRIHAVITLTSDCTYVTAHTTSAWLFTSVALFKVLE